MTHLARLFRRHLLFTGINLTGLAVGIAGFLFVAIYLHGELTVDRGFTHADRTYRLANTITLPGNAPLSMTTTDPAFASLLTEEFPEVEAVTRLLGRPVSLGRSPDSLAQAGILWVDPNVLDVLDLPWLDGDRTSAFAEPDSIVVTPDLARRLFGDVDPLGQTVTMAGGTTLRVTGVVGDLGSRSHLRYEALIPDGARGPESFDRAPRGSSAQAGASTYLRLAPATDLASLRLRLPTFLERHGVGIPDRNAMPDFLRLRLDPLADIHLHVKSLDDPRDGGDPTTVAILFAVAVVILAIAMLNYANLATAQALQRAKEVGVRKLAGARRRHLVGLFLGESVALAAASTLLAVGLVELLMPAFNDLVGRTIATDDLWRWPLLLAPLSAPLLAGGLGGLYPALVLSGYRPAVVLKGTAAPGSGRLQAGIVVVQFAISISLVVATLTVHRQVEHARSSNLGFTAENLYVVAPVGEMDGQTAVLARDIAALPGVLAVTWSDVVPANPGRSISSVTVLGRGTEASLTDPLVSHFGVDVAFPATYGLELVGGAGLPEGWQPPDPPIDPEDGQPMAAASGIALITETAVKALGFASMEEALGAELGIGPDGTKWPTRIVGVVRDLRLRSARDEPEPIVFTFGQPSYFLTARLAAGDPRPTVAAIAAAVDRLMPDRSKVRQYFLDDEIDALYREEERQARVFATFAVLAIVLANMGLFGLTALAAARRTKEIGVRRVVGAGVPSIVALLCAQFVKPVVLANLIAWPVAWLLLDRWLSGFAVRIELDAGPFLLGGAAGLTVALVTVAVHATRVALIPPARALRYE